MQSQDCVVCTIVHRAVKQRRNTRIADIIGIADIVIYYRYYRLTQHWTATPTRAARVQQQRFPKRT